MKSAHFRYALIYVVITFLVLLILNIYSSKTIQNMFYNSTKTSMLEKCYLVSGSVSGLEVLTEKTVWSAVSGFENLNVSRLIITDYIGLTVYDSDEIDSVTGKYALFPEIVSALAGNNVVIWNYHDGTMHSTAAIPVYSYGTLIGCVYLTEHDTTQGSVIASLQNNIFTITMVLELIVILWSLVFSDTYSLRLRKIIASIRTVREGDYSNKLSLRGHDELNILSNEFNDLIDRLQASENTRNQFVSDASHELKTPLASIKLLSDSIMQNDMDMETVREFVGDIGNEADRLNKMSHKLLTLSRADMQTESDFEIIHVAPTVERVIRMLHAQAEENDIYVHSNLTQNCPVMISDDDLYQVIFNLMENGIKYNKSNGILSITLKRQDDNAILQISDSGVGIPEDSLPHIFERFYRVDKARSRSTGGSGLGLSIVRRIVERNNGQISVSSKVGIGTTFTLTFPIFDTKEDT